MYSTIVSGMLVSFNFISKGVFLFYMLPDETKANLFSV